MDEFLATEGLALFAVLFPAALGVAGHTGPRTPYAVRLLAEVALAFAVGGLGLRLAAEVVSRDYQLHGSPRSGFYLPVGLSVSSAVFLLLGVLLTATSGAMALAAAARRQAWDWLLLLALGTMLPLLVALCVFLCSMHAYYTAPSGLVSPLFVGLLLLTTPPLVLPLLLAPLTSAVYGNRAVQLGRLTAPGAMPARPSRLSRRQLLVIAGLVFVGGTAWLLAHALLPDRLTSLGFVRRTKGRTTYIVPPLVSVPAGEFLMGSDPAKDRLAVDNEQPQRRLTLDAFQIAKYPVTVAEYAAFVQQTGYSTPPDYGDSRNPSLMTQQEQPDHSVTSVTWFDATLYAQWLAQLTGGPWRLPTEAEWEKAARGTDGRLYPWGNQWDGTRANTSDGGPGTTTPVGTYPTGASPYGAQDPAGNVSEWTSSLYRPYPYQQDDGRERPYGRIRKRVCCVAARGRKAHLSRARQAAAASNHWLSAADLASA